MTATINGCELIKEMVLENVLPDAGSSESVSRSEKFSLIHETINDIINTNKFMLVSINRCMDYAKVTNGVKLLPKFETCDVQESIRTVLNCLSSSSHRQQVKVSPLPNTMYSHILTDKQWLQENILCLLSNAVKFTPNGRIDLRLSLIKAGEDYAGVSSKSTIQLARSTPVILVEVEDNGIGISKEMQVKLFAPFQQAQKNAGGTGLGLYSLSQRVEALGGRYGVRDRLDGQQGSLFWFTLPYRPDVITANMLQYDLAILKQSSPRMNDAKRNLASIVPLDRSCSDDDCESPTNWNSLSNKFKNTVAKVVSGHGNYVNRSFMLSSFDEFSRDGEEDKGVTVAEEDDETVLAALSQSKDIGRSHVDGSYSSRGVTTRQNTTNHISLQSTSSPSRNANISGNKQYCVLLADDSTAIRQVLMKILQRGGHEVVAVENGFEALNAIKDRQEKGEGEFDVALLDLHMPVLDGFETMKRIRQDEQHQTTPSTVDKTSPIFIVGCSANDDEDTLNDLKSAGANAFLTKPFTLHQFEACMATKC